MAVTALLGIVLAACTSTPDAAPASSSGPDCTLARTAMDDYSVALQDLATSMEAGDAMSAIAAADGMSYALDQLQEALPGMPAEGATFVAASRAVAVKVKQAAADSPAMSGLLADLTSDFADPAFEQGGAAIDAYVDQACPPASPSAS